MIKDKTPTLAPFPFPYQIVGSSSGIPIILRAKGNRVILSFKGIEKSFPTREAALLYLQGITNKRKGNNDKF